MGKEDYNLTTDVYSYGLLCHQILTLEKPYDDIHDDDHDEYVFHRHVRPHIPQALPVPTQHILFRSWAPILAFRPTCAKFCDLLKQDRTAIIQNGVPSSSSSDRHHRWRTSPRVRLHQYRIAILLLRLLLLLLLLLLLS